MTDDLQARVDELEKVMRSALRRLGEDWPRREIADGLRIGLIGRAKFEKCDVPYVPFEEDQGD